MLLVVCNPGAFVLGSDVAAFLIRPGPPRDLHKLLNVAECLLQLLHMSSQITSYQKMELQSHITPFASTTLDVLAIVRDQL